MKNGSNCHYDVALRGANHHVLVLIRNVVTKATWAFWVAGTGAVARCNSAISHSQSGMHERLPKKHHRQNKLYLKTTYFMLSEYDVLFLSCSVVCFYIIIKTWINCLDFRRLLPETILFFNWPKGVNTHK